MASWVGRSPVKKHKGDQGEVCSVGLPRAACCKSREGRGGMYTKNRPRALFTQRHIWFHSNHLWIIRQFSFVVWFVCLFFKNSHFLSPWFSKHLHVPSFPDRKSFEGVLMPQPALTPHFPPQAAALYSLAIGFILKHFLFCFVLSRFESIWEYFSWQESSLLKDPLF